MTIKESSNLISEGPKVKVHHDRPEKFKGNDFKTWQSKMMFYLTTLGLSRFLTEDVSTPKEGQTVEKNKEIFLAIEAWKNSNFLCRNYILNSLDEILYKVYNPIKTSKLLWEALEKNYKTEDDGLKKFVVKKFMSFRGRLARGIRKEKESRMPGKKLSWHPAFLSSVWIVQEYHSPGIHVSFSSVW